MAQWMICCCIGCSESLFGEPLFTFLDVFIEQLSHVTDDECQDYRRKKFRRPSELAFNRRPQFWGQTGVNRGNRLHQNGARVFIKELRLREEPA
jgi:hypothetical protein